MRQHNCSANLAKRNLAESRLKYARELLAFTSPRIIDQNGGFCHNISGNLGCLAFGCQWTRSDIGQFAGRNLFHDRSHVWFCGLTKPIGGWALGILSLRITRCQMPTHYHHASTVAGGVLGAGSRSKWLQRKGCAGHRVYCSRSFGLTRRLRTTLIIPRDLVIRRWPITRKGLANAVRANQSGSIA